MVDIRNRPNTGVLERLEKEEVALKRHIAQAQEAAELQALWAPIRERLEEKIKDVETALDNFAGLPERQVMLLLQQRLDLRSLQNLPDDLASDMNRLQSMLLTKSAEVKEYRDRLGAVRP